MRRVNLALALALLCAPRLAGAEVLDTSDALAAGHVRVMAGAEFGLSDPNPIRLDLQERIGLASGLDVYLVQAIGLHREDGVRLGGGLKWNVLPRKKDRPGIALWGGGFYQTAREVAGATGRFLIDFRFGRVTPYGALDLDLWFTDGVDSHLTALGGARVSIVPHVAAFFEAGVDLTGRQRDHLAALGIALEI